MPIYEYACKNCNYQEEISHSIKDQLLTVCPKCNINSLYVVPSVPTISVKEVKTLGQLAEKNAKNMGRYGLEEKIAQDKLKEKSAAAEDRKFMSKLGNASPEQQQRYIETGKL